MMRKTGFIGVLILLAAMSQLYAAGPVSLYNFDGDLTAAVGSDLTEHPGQSGMWAFENTSQYGDWARMNGRHVNIIRVFGDRLLNGFHAPNDLSQPYEYTVVIDLLNLPASGWTGNTWRSGGGVFDAQIGGDFHQVYQGAGWQDLATTGSGVFRDTWQRFVFTINTGNGVAVYQNGSLIGSVANGDARNSGSWWYAGGGFDLIFNLYEVFVASIAIYDGVMTPVEVLELGGPHPDGAGSAGILPSEPGQMTGLWNFTGGPDPSDGLNAEIGLDMRYDGAENGTGTAEQAALWLRNNTEFVATDGVNVPHINGQTAYAMHVPSRLGYDSFFSVPHGVPTPNGGGGIYTTEYSVAMDILYVPQIWTGGIWGSGVHRSWFEMQVGTTRPTQILKGGYVDMAGTGPALFTDEWNRFFFTVDAGNMIKVYQNGELVNSYDDSDVEPGDSYLATNHEIRLARQISECYLNSVAVFHGALTPLEVAAYGGPDPNGIIVPSSTPQCGDPGTVYLWGDLDKDCDIDMADFARFVDQWLACTDPRDSSCDIYWK